MLKSYFPTFRLKKYAVQKRLHDFYGSVDISLHIVQFLSVMSRNKIAVASKRGTKSCFVAEVRHALKVLFFFILDSVNGKAL